MRRTLSALFLLAAVALVLPAHAAIAVTGPGAGGKIKTTQGTSVYYTVATITGALEGISAVEVTVTLPAPTVSGSAIVLVTGDLDTAVITATLRDSRFADAEADVINTTDTVAGAGRASIVVELFQNVTKDARMSLPAGTYTFRLVSSNAGSAGAVSATLLFVHTP